MKFKTADGVEIESGAPVFVTNDYEFTISEGVFNRVFVGTDHRNVDCGFDKLFFKWCVYSTKEAATEALRKSAKSRIEGHKSIVDGICAFLGVTSPFVCCNDPACSAKEISEAEAAVRSAGDESDNPVAAAA